VETNGGYLFFVLLHNTKRKTINGGEGAMELRTRRSGGLERVEGSKDSKESRVPVKVCLVKYILYKVL
jgi:hypothetical protein